ncbi:MAG: UDP-N-acetylmuramate--L-alanine ligase [Candidatus Omnitrophica bacterium]|jgi:UDP-N-acetylmuramate--alanine ligase|nr:UDP-N-acetylmuramate--L-alanine ligase [Candidatus Omnitrophota bacterium]
MKSVEHMHFIGIGGIGMSGIARILLSCGRKVSGSDLKESFATEELRAAGANIFIGHNAENIRGADLVVYSSAIKESNPEIIEAKKQKIPLIKRAEALAELMRDKDVITVAGSHGKTTTTSLVSYLLIEAGLNPSVAIGGILKNTGNNACWGKGELFVAEADESDGSFLFYRPKYSIITNIDHEHLDYYGDFQSEINAFEKFINKTVPDGCIFYCADDSSLIKIMDGYKGRRVSFGLRAGADVFPENIAINGLSSEFDCMHQGKSLGKFYLALGGMHNISNALAVIALGMELGIDLKFIRNALAGYKGAGRRIEIKLKNNDYLIIDDYAHHPTEIKATLSAIKRIGAKRIIVVFQPHRYTRTKLLMDEFSSCFDLADVLIITDIYAASEPPIKGISGSQLAEKIKAQHKDTTFVVKENLASYILEIIKTGDLVATLGAGDITRICDELVEKIKG